MPDDEAARAATDFQEVAEDMLDVLQRLGNLERKVQEAVNALGDLRRSMEESAAQQARMLEAVRAEISGERRAFATRALFEPVASALDSLELLARGLKGAREQAAQTQVRAAAATLANVILALGYQRFDVVRGEPFDGTRMQCFGYAEGEQGVVLSVVQPGYSASNVVIRPARVLIADPAARAGNRVPASADRRRTS